MENVYKTKDFYLSCALKSKGFEVVGTEKHDKTVHFIFKNHDDALLKKILTEFINMELDVNLKKYTFAMKDLRLMLN